MKKILSLLFVILLGVPAIGQQVTDTGKFTVPEYDRCIRNKKVGIAGIAVFGTTWLAGNVICTVKQNTYANDNWDGNDAKEFARLSNEAMGLKEYKIGQALSIAGCIGTGVSIITAAVFGTKARNIRNSQGDILATIGMGLSPDGLSLDLTF